MRKFRILETKINDTVYFIPQIEISISHTTGWFWWKKNHTRHEWWYLIKSLDGKEIYYSEGKELEKSYSLYGNERIKRVIYFSTKEECQKCINQEIENIRLLREKSIQSNHLNNIIAGRALQSDTQIHTLE